MKFLLEVSFFDSKGFGGTVGFIATAGPDVAGACGVAPEGVPIIGLPIIGRAAELCGAALVDAGIVALGAGAELSTGLPIVGRLTGVPIIGRDTVFAG
ncbi:MAG: hypothetical protein ACYC7D_10515 [Nitrososphaerales archaeon]